LAKIRDSPNIFLGKTVFIAFHDKPVMVDEERNIWVISNRLSLSVVVIIRILE